MQQVSARTRAIATDTCLEPPHPWRLQPASCSWNEAAWEPWVGVFGVFGNLRFTFAGFGGNAAHVPRKPHVVVGFRRDVLHAPPTPGWDWCVLGAAMRYQMSVALFVSVACAGVGTVQASREVATPWRPNNVRDLHNEYYNIFKRGNRNAASHLWASFLLDRAPQLSEDTLRLMFGGFCAVSGSPVLPGDYSRYRMTLDTVTGSTIEGYTYFCCWPCVCDTQDFIRVDTRNVTTADGADVPMHFLVIGNPCTGNHDRIPWEAPEVVCNGQELSGATMSDHDFVIISMFFPIDAARADATDTLPHNHETAFRSHCEQRAQMGYNSGMGEIFRKVASIAPLQTRTHLGELCAVPGVVNPSTV